MSAVRVQFLGSGTPLGQDGRLQACILVTTEQARLLVDCGQTSMLALARTGLHPDALDAVLISHLHGDHFGGLPLLLLERSLRERLPSRQPPRARPLSVAGPPATADRVRQALEAFGWNTAWEHAQWSGEVSFQALHEREPTRVAGVEVAAFAVPHVPSTEPSALRLSAGGKTLAYSGDAGWSDALIEVAAGADLFICGVWSFDTADHTFLDFRTLMAHRAELTCRRLILTHLGPSMLEHLAEVKGEGIEIAEDGLTLEL